MTDACAPFHKMQFLFLLFYVLSNLYLFTYYIVTMTTIILHYEQTKYSIMTLAVLSPQHLTEVITLPVSQQSILFAHKRDFQKLPKIANVTYYTERFLGSAKTANLVSLDVRCSRKNENNQIIYTYLNSAKNEDSGYTNF